MKKYKLQNIQSPKRPIMVFFYFEKGVLLKQFKSFYKEQYGVIVICKNEEDQEKVYNKLLDQGYECKVVTT